MTTKEPILVKGKMPNKRISVEHLKNGSFLVAFKAIKDPNDDRPSAIIKVHKNKIKETQIGLSEDALRGLYDCISLMLKHIDE